MRRTLKIFFHDNCFDGTASAAIFSDFYHKHIDDRAAISYQGVQHSNGDPFQGLAVDGDDNACVDFRYDERMSWWFDHHVSAFQPSERRAHFEADTSGQKFFDPRAQSCTKFLSEVLREKYGYELPERFSELVKWADIIDGAQFSDPKVAVEIDRPATQLMTWIRHNKDAELTHRYISALRHRSLDELAALDWVREPLKGLLQQHVRTIELVRQRAVHDGGVVSVDLTDAGVVTYNSFISYFLFPNSRYTIGIVSAEGFVRISVGYNPWSDFDRRHNIAAICERFGGGGHPSVGGIALPASRLQRGREIVNVIRAELMDC